MAKSTGKPTKRPEQKPQTNKRRQAPGKTIQARENQIISLAYDLVEQRIRRGTATSQEVTTFIKMGSSLAQLEKSKLERETEVLVAKAESMKSQKKIEELYSEAMRAFRTYSGQEEISDEED